MNQNHSCSHCSLNVDTPCVCPKGSVDKIMEYIEPLFRYSDESHDRDKSTLYADFNYDGVKIRKDFKKFLISLE